MARPTKTYQIDVDFYSMEFTVRAKSKAEARRKAKNSAKVKIKSHINHIYIDEI